MPKSPTFARRPINPDALPFECTTPGCDAFPFATEAEAAACQHTFPGDVIRPTVEAIRLAAPASTAPVTVPTPTSSGRFVTVDNGFGGTTTRSTRQVATARTGEASEKSKTFLRTLLAEREGIAEAEAVRATLNGHRTAGTLTQRVVSKAIDDLKAITVVRTTKMAEGRTVEAHGRATIDKAALPTPARGVLRFAVPNESGSLTFLAFKYRGEDVIVCQEIGGSGDDNYLGRQNAGTAYRGRLSNLVAKVMADPTEAMLTYGREIGRCGHCGTTLTNEASRLAGIGPICAQKG